MRIHSLDGLRAIAAGLVVAAHIAKQKHLPGFEFLGSLGVHLFFVVSGYLITTLLLQEEQRSGVVSLQKFWLRRAWRILPAYLAYIAAIAMVARFNPELTLSPVSLFGALTFTTGWVPGDWELGHLWSLAVETQFYLFWPVVMQLRNTRWRWVVACLLMAIGILGRIAVYHWIGPDRMLASVCNLDSIIVGCVLALGFHSARPAQRREWVKIRAIALPVAASAVALMIYLSHAKRLGLLTVPLGNTVVAAGLTLFLLEILCREEGMLHGLLNSRVMVWIGTLSYGIYLWQQLILRPQGVAPLFGVGAWINRPEISATLILTVATASYCLLERPFLKKRRQLH